jgi:hypothetical protein
MNKFLLFAILITAASCTHNYSPKSYKVANKTGPIIHLSNYNDTLILGDTLGLEFYLRNPITLDDGSLVNIKSISNTGIGYNFDKSFSSGSTFYLYPMVVEKNKSYLQYDGMFLFKPKLIPLIGTTIHYVPQDTGTYVITTDRFQYLVCTTEESKDEMQINFFPDFNTSNKHLNLLDSFATSKIGYDYAKQNYAAAYYCFYVKHK